MKKLLLFLIATIVIGSCIKPDSFDLGGDWGVLTSVEAKAPQLIYEQTPDQTMQLYWANDDAIDIYYTALSQWSNFTFDNRDTDELVAEFYGEQRWKPNVRSHIFYAMHPAKGLEASSDIDPSAVELTLPKVQDYERGVESYMVSSCAVKVEGGNPLSFEFEPSLAVIEINMTAKSNFTLKTLNLALSGATERAITGDYKLDVSDNSINSRTAKGREVTINFGDGMTMSADNTYKAYAVVLPSKLAGAKFTVSGTTAASSVELVVVEASEYKKGNIYSLAVDVVPGPISREYSFAATSGSYGTSGANSNMLSYQGLYSKATTNNKGIAISASKVDEEFEGGSTTSKDVFWEVTAPEWVTLSQYSGTGAANIDVFVTPNVKPLTAATGASTTNLSATGTSNSYIISAPGKYKFDASVMGNGNAGVISSANFTDYKGAVISTAAISGAVSAKLLWQDMAGQFTDVTLNGNFVEFTTASNIYPGNAVIALYDASNKIIWSWHIWFTNPVSTDKITNANTNPTAIATEENIYYMMDRSMGALGLPSEVASQSVARNGNIVVTQYTDNTKTIPTGKSFSVPVYQIGIMTTNDYKLLFVGGVKYQWGRKDPFMMPYTSNSKMGWIDANGNFTPASGSFADNATTAVTIADLITSPTTMYTKNNSVISPANNYVWGNVIKAGYSAADYVHSDNQRGIKTIYDPSPEGYTVPAIDAFSYFSYANRVGAYGAAEYAGLRLKANPTDTQGILFSQSGYISSTGGVLGLGATPTASYYSNSVSTGSGSFAYQMRYTSTTTLNNPESQNRNPGHNVRCVKQ